jgi:hypothetical protein
LVLLPSSPQSISGLKWGRRRRFVVRASMLALLPNDAEPLPIETGVFVETEWYNRAELIQKRILQLRDSL